MAITDLTGCTWVGNDTMQCPGTKNYSVTTTFTSIDGASNAETISLGLQKIGQDAFLCCLKFGTARFNMIFGYYAYSVGDLTVLIKNIDDGLSGVITFTGGTDATDPELIAWLEANGTLTSGGDTVLDVTYNSQKIIDSLEVTPPVTVTYNGSTIATLNDGDTKTLSCNGKVMESDVVIGGKTLQCNGKLMASNVVVEVGGGVTPTSETWVINEVPVSAENDVFTVDFYSNNIRHIYFVLSLAKGGALSIKYLITATSETVVYTLSSGWLDQAYRTITLDSPATGDFLTWLEANAVKQ